MKSKVKIDVQIETAKLNMKLAQLHKTTGQELSSLLADASFIFAQSASKATPVSPTERYWRPITPDESNAFQLFCKNPKFRVTNPHSFWQYIQQNFDEKFEWVHAYKVYVRTARKRRRKVFSQLQEVFPWLPIKFRGLGKFSWWVLPLKLGKPIVSSFKFSDDAKSAGMTAADVTDARGGLTPYIQLDNHVINIGRYANYAAAQALRKSKNRIGAMLKASADSIAKSFNREMYNARRSGISYVAID